MAKNELLPFANGEDANVLPTNQWEALTDILENGFQSGIARSEQVNRVLSQGAVASYVLGQLIVDQLNKDATLNKDTLYQNLVSALQENSKDVCLPLIGGNVTGNLTVQSKNVVRSVNGVNANVDGNVALQGSYVTETWRSGYSWYRKWSDGWIEQGGILDYTGTISKTESDSKSVTFPVAFTDKQYTFVAVSNRTNCYAFEGDNGTYEHNKRSLTGTYVGFRNVNIQDSSSGRKRACWYACGY